MDEFLIELQAKLDEAKSKGNINSDIGTLQRQIDKLQIQAEIDQDTISKLTKEIEEVINKKITISNIEVDTTQAVKSAQKTGQQIGKVISDAASKAINNVSSKNIGKYFKVSPSDSKQFQNEMEKLVNGWTNGKGKVKDINIQTRTSYDEKSGQNVERLHQALVTYENELNEVVKKTIAWRQIGTKTNNNGEEEALHGFIEVAGQYSKSLDTVTAKTDNFAKKQKETIANMQNTIKQIESGAYDKNSSRPITSDDSLNRLDTQLAYVENAMYDLKHATAETFDDARIRVQNEISDLKILTKELRNSDNVSTKMKGTDLSSGLSIAKNDLEKFKSDAKDFPQITQTIKDLDSAISSVGDTASLNSFNDQLRVARSELAKIKSETNTSNREEKVGINISGLQSKIADLQRTSPEIEKFKAEINGAEVTVQTLYSDLEKVNTQSDFSVINSKWKAFTDATKSAGIAVTEVWEKTDVLSKQLIKAHTDIENKTIDKNISDITKQFNQIPNATDELKSDFNDLIRLHEVLGKSQTDEELIQNYNKLNETLVKVKNTMGILKNESKDISEPIDILASQKKINGLANRVLSFKENNSAMSHSLSNSLDEMYKHLISGSKITQKEFDNLESKFSDIKLETRDSGKMGKSFIGRLKDDISNFMSWGFATGLAGQSIQTAKKMVSEVYNVDTAMTNLYKVTDETKNKYNEFLTSSSSNAQELGRSVSSLVEQSANWAKLGYTIDESETLAKTSSIYANVGEVDDDTAVADIVTAMKAYGIKAEEAIKIVNSYNKLGNEFATDAKSLGDGISNAASSLATAGNDMDQSLGMLTGMTEIMQNASEAGNALKILSMRLRGYDEETESYSNDIENLKGDIASLTKTAKTPGGISIFSDKDKQTYKSTYQIMKEISEIWDDLTDKNRAQLTEVIAGKQRGNAISALIQAFQSGQVEKAVNASKNSAGSAMQEQERWMESLEAKTQQFQAAFQTLSNTIIDSDLLKFFVDLGTGAVNALDGIIGEFNSISSLATSGNSIFGTIGALSGLLMNIKGIGERFAFQW